MYILYSTITLF